MKNEPQEIPDVPVLFTPSANGGKGRAKPYRKTQIIEGKRTHEYSDISSEASIDTFFQTKTA